MLALPGVLLAPTTVHVYEDHGPPTGQQPGTEGATERAAVLVGWCGVHAVVMVLEGKRKGGLVEVAAALLTFTVDDNAAAAATRARAQRSGLVV